MMPKPDFIYHLPDEMLLNMASFLPTSDLLELSVTSKRIGASAQEALYRSIVIPRSRDAQKTGLALLLRTLLSRPSFAKHIKNLDIYPRRRSVDVDFVVAITKTVPMAVTTISIDVGAANIQMYEAKIAAVILVLASNLASLSVNILSERYHDDRAYKEDSPDSIMRALFGTRHDCDQPMTLNYMSVPGLANLNSLRVEGLVLDPNWSKLERLQRMAVGHRTIIGGYLDFTMKKDFNFGVLALEMNFNQEILNPDQANSRASWDTDLPSFLKYFGGLKEFHARLHNVCSWWQGEWKEFWWERSFAAMIGKLSPLQSTLEILVIEALTARSQLPSAKPSHIVEIPGHPVQPLNTLMDFPILRKVTLPQAALPFGPLENIFPLSLEKLKIEYPTPDTLFQLALSYKDRSTTATPLSIEACFLDGLNMDVNTPFAEFMELDLSHFLQNNGVRVALTCSGRDFLATWEKYHNAADTGVIAMIS